ncbi:MAG: SCO family protein [Alphaproteobacteria bacterium GM7ARS4]|nr:SCO family protein [Alphaproteobacteria bacterium GM7ARS4]
MSLLSRKMLHALTLGLAVAFVFGTGLLLFMSNTEGDMKHMGAHMGQGHSAIGQGQFSLIDHHGTRHTFDDKGARYKLVFFGFTHCPDVCPIALSSMTAMLEKIPATTREKILPLFITVDPQRDTPSRLKEYRKAFAPDILMLTGSHEELDHVYEIFKVYVDNPADNTKETQHHHHQKQESHTHDSHAHHAMQGYGVNHSSFIYLQAPDNRLITYFSHDDSVQTLIETVMRTIDS